MSRIVDGFIFYNELDLLELRLKENWDVVDYFIIVEATKTFSNQDKILYFDVNQDRYQQYRSKIIHVIVDDMPDGTNPWIREVHQRNCISRGLQQLSLNDKDFICVSDADEILNPETLQKIKLNPEPFLNHVYTFEQSMFYYHLECVAKDKWQAACMFSYRLYHQQQFDIHSVRTPNPSKNIIRNGGWHLSYFGGVDTIKTKMTNFSHHQEFENTIYLTDDYIQKRIDSCDDLFLNKEYRRLYVFDNVDLPRYYRMIYSSKPLTVLYGNSTRYINVTLKCLETFRSGHLIIIPGNYNFNDLFTDPCLLAIKKVVILLNQEYIVIMENNSAMIEINIETGCVLTNNQGSVSGTLPIIINN
jgi:beta-1,4-mannosyl-glycoprotein beta-1,4-N-acetylglucosaminyltransferase